MFIAPVARRLSDRIGGKFILMTGLSCFALFPIVVLVVGAASCLLIRRTPAAPSVAAVGARGGAPSAVSGQDAGLATAAAPAGALAGHDGGFAGRDGAIAGHDGGLAGRDSALAGQDGRVPFASTAAPAPPSGPAGGAGGARPVTGARARQPQSAGLVLAGLRLRQA